MTTDTRMDTLSKITSPNKVFLASNSASNPCVSMRLMFFNPCSQDPPLGLFPSSPLPSTLESNLQLERIVP